MTLSASPGAISFYVAIGVTMILSYRVIQRLKESRSNQRDERIGLFTRGYVTAVIGALSLLFFPFLLMLVQTTVAYVEYPQYIATVVEVESDWEERTYTDSDGHSHTETVLMHHAILEFMDESGELIRRPNNVKSGDKPDIGDTIRISYQDGQLHEFSFRAIALNLGLGFMLLIMGYCLLLIYNYGAGRSNEKLILKGQMFVIVFVIPAAMLLMLSAMAYALFLYFIGQKEIPLIFVFILSFFCIMLFLGFMGYVKWLRSNEE